MDKKWAIIPVDKKIVEALQQSLGISPLLCQLLVQRNIQTFDQARQFFRPNLDQLHDPFLMKDMDKAVKRLSDAIKKGEKILLYGDYDVDGTSSVAMMYHFLRHFQAQLDYYIPDRYLEGYGISLEGIDYAVQKKVALIIAMDCGIKAIEAAKRAQQEGIDLIICDHHLPGDQLPEAFAILDPKQTKCTYPYPELSGCGVAFKLAQAYVIRQELDWQLLDDLLDLLVISIASDIVPMTGENRVLAHFGLKKLNRSQKPGLKALITQSGKTRPLNISDIVFGLAPMINAAGRLADADQASRLMLAEDKAVAYEYARVLQQRNKIRKEFDQRTVEEAKAMYQQNGYLVDRQSLVLFQPHWHKGIVGITASRMVETFHRPTVILTEAGGLAVGSARSVSGFDLYKALELCQDLLINFGGHAHAAGLSLRLENVPVFADRFEGAVATLLAGKQLVPEIPIAATIQLEEITPKFWRILKQFAPFGPHNRSPVFASYGVCDTGASRQLRGNHLELFIQQNESRVFKGIGFGLAHHLEMIKKRPAFDICYTLQENIWQGNRSLQLIVRDIKSTH